jgi:hypothetical protein
MKIMKPMMVLSSLGLLAATIALSPVPVIPTSYAAVEVAADGGPEATVDPFEEASRGVEKRQLNRRRDVFLTPPPKPREAAPAPRPVRVPAPSATAQPRRTTSASRSTDSYEPYYRPFRTGSTSKTGLSDFKRRRLERDRQMARYREALQRAQRRRGR